MHGVSVVIPALNEEKSLEGVIKELKEGLKKSGLSFEIIVVDDGSTDQTSKIAQDNGARVLSHPQPGGYGLSLRDGILSAKYDWIAIIDADQTYPANRVGELVGYLDKYDMVVGARTGAFFRESLVKYPMRQVFHFLCEFVTGIKIPDVNSGFRAFKKDAVLKYKENFCLGFSFTTTITLAFHLNGHFVKYVPVAYQKRKGKSHVRLLQDTLRTAQIITQAILYYNPIKLFLLLFIATFVTALLCFGFYTINNSTLLLIIGQSFFIIAFVYLGMGFIADICRQRKA